MCSYAELGLDEGELLGNGDGSFYSLALLLFGCMTQV